MRIWEKENRSHHEVSHNHNHNHNHNPNPRKKRKEKKRKVLSWERERERAAIMNLFRLLGDMTHLLSIVVLLLKIRNMKSCAGMYLICYVSAQFHSSSSIVQFVYFCLFKSMWLDFIVFVLCSFGSNSLFKRNCLV